ncbi:MAG: chromate efflux transporter [Saprospiraceae bacterium]|nr:chromate efflux transporter [Saprospiraceae bacterium]
MTRFIDIFWFFVRAGAFSFGEPEQHVKLMHNELVTKKHILDEETFVQLRRQSSNIPGPLSFQLTMRIGHHQKGLAGLLIAGIGFLLPSVLLMLVFALYYKEFAVSEFKLIDPFFYGIRAAIISILVYTTLVYCIRYIKDIKLFGIFLIITIAAAIGINAILLVLLGGFAYVLLRNTGSVKKATMLVLLQAQPQYAIPLVEHQKLIALFLKAGSFLIGSGFFILTWIKLDLVDTGVITINTLLDSLALGLFVPGPILSISVFIGYMVNSWIGAAFAIMGIVMPLLIFAFLSIKVFPKFMATIMWKAFFRGMVVASLGILMGTILVMGYQSLVDIRQWIIFVLCLLIMLKWHKLNLLWIIIISGNLGYIILHFFPI